MKRSETGMCMNYEMYHIANVEAKYNFYVYNVLHGMINMFICGITYCSKVCNACRYELDKVVLATFIPI